MKFSKTALPEAVFRKGMNVRMADSQTLSKKQNPPVKGEGLASKLDLAQYVKIPTFYRRVW